MPFYPLFSALENSGFVQLANFAPNNWEKVTNGLKNIFSLVTDGQIWRVSNLGKIPENEFRNFKTEDFSLNKSSKKNDIFIEELVLLDMRNGFLSENLIELPYSDLLTTHWPEWRATIGFNSENSRVSYQGEINPTPSKATLLTFHPFIQFEDIKNYFIFLNIEKSPVFRWSEIDIFLSGSGEKIDTKKIRNNSANIIPLDDYGFTSQDLPVFYCKSMAGIPFGFGKSISSGMLSLEHTHPPGSFTIHGDRLLSQRNIKADWAKYLKIQNPLSF